MVVTGLGALTPIGNDVRSYWEALVQGVSGAVPITRFDASRFKTRFACELKGFDETDHFERKEIRTLDPYSQYAMVAAREGIADAGLLDDKLDKERIGVIWGSGVGGLLTFQEEVSDFVRGDGAPRFNPYFIPKMIADIASGHISMKYGFKGPNFTTVSACASAANAIIDSYNYICLGKAEAIVCGGSEAAITEAGIGGFNALRALSTRNDAPETASRPFDRDRDGFVLGEGAGCLVLEEYEHAQARGAKVYCEMVGGGLSADAHHVTAPHPQGEGFKAVMRNALADARVSTLEVDHINMHGTSTPLGDKTEVKAIEEVFGPEHAYQMNLNSTKSMTGHLLGATGAVELIALILTLAHGIIPPTINHFTDDAEIDSRLNFTFNKAQRRRVDIAMSNTFGFGGHNACILIKRL